ncbi:hypothetical protein MPSEU_000269900 [Mayamaea pseudoterrestris]|nr:hypothetical protein MPSEU_000269900 [Mayamaea pseudoterrestris]
MTRFRRSQVLAAYCFLLLSPLLLIGTHRSGLTSLSTEQETKAKGFRDLASGGYLIRKENRPPAFPFINDVTIFPTRNVSRPWQFNSSAPQPPYKLILTDFGWNHFNQSRGLTFGRSLRSRELVHGMVDHPYFDATIGWSQIVDGTYILDLNTRYYIFMDVETCFESNYPIYMDPADGFAANADLVGGRTFSKANAEPCYSILDCDYLYETLETVHKHPNVMLVAYYCRGWGPTAKFRKELVTTNQLSIVAASMSTDEFNPHVDQGLPPGRLNAVELGASEIEAINSCGDRPYLVTFVGEFRAGPREALLYNMSNGHDAIFLSTRDFHNQFPSITYSEMLKKSVYGAAPRGDNLFSYRFTEVLSAGAIPVVHSDGWVLPFHDALIKWSETCAIIIPEAKVHETEHILRGITKEERCRRQRNCLDLYQKYFSSPQGTVRGIIDALEFIQKRDELLVKQQ